MNFDVVIVGGGPGGYVCAIRASQLGLKVALVDKTKAELGGTCLTKGCIPTKTILQSAEVYNFIQRSSEYGIDCNCANVSIEKIVSRAKSIIGGLNAGVNGLMAKNKITLIEGIAKIKNKETVVVNDLEIVCKNIVIATGAKPRLISGTEELLNDGLVWTSKEAIFPKFLPKKLLIVGSGANGVELATFYNTLGSNVTIVEMLDRILPQEDGEISATAKKLYEKQGINIITNGKTQNFKKQDGKISVEINGNAEMFDVAIIAIGVVPNTDNLGLDEVGIIRKKNGTIETNEYNETSIKGIYAIGDVAEAPWLAHKASREGIRVAEKIANKAEITPINLKCIPSCTYSNPQIASIGLTEEKAKDCGLNIKVGKSHYRCNGRALSSGEPDGFVKVIFEAKSGELLGAHMIGHGVTEMLPIFSVAIAGELTEYDLMNAVFPHPTMSECIQEAVYSAYNMSISG